MSLPSTLPLESSFLQWGECREGKLQRKVKKREGESGREMEADHRQNDSIGINED